MTDLEGFSIRKPEWHKLLSEFPEIASLLKIKLCTNFFYKIQLKVMARKRREIDNMKQRSDVN